MQRYLCMQEKIENDGRRTIENNNYEQRHPFMQGEIENDYIRTEE